MTESVDDVVDDRLHSSSWSKPMKSLPKPGLYMSTQKVVGMRIVVEEVFGPTDDDPDDDFYIVNFIDEASKDDFSAMGDEMDGEQWEAFVAEYGLVHQG